MSAQTLDPFLLTPLSSGASGWKRVEHETLYTLQYRDSVPYIFGPADKFGHSTAAAVELPDHQIPRLGISIWWKLTGLGILTSLLVLIFLLPMAVASTTKDSAPKSATAIAGISATLDRLSASQGSSSVVLVSHLGGREVSAYADPQAYTTVSTVAGEMKDSVLSTNPDGALVYYFKTKPENVYLVYPKLPYQLEIFDPAPGTSLKLAKTPGFIDSLLF